MKVGKEGGREKNMTEGWEGWRDGGRNLPQHVFGVAQDAVSLPGQ